MKNTVQAHSRAMSWFGLIGAAAAAVHYIIAISLEALSTIPIAWINVIGFLCAFPVSYLGHSKLSFSSHAHSVKQSLPRFFSVAILGFIGNQILVLSALHFLKIPFWIVLAIVMVIVAAFTYLLSHYWAFRSK
ncbi:MAG: GtrA family protein [Methylophilaceae bacterium]